MSKKTIPWRIQETQFTCGPSAFRNCLLVFGIHASEKRLRELMDTTKDGTDENGICQATEEFNLNYKMHCTSSKDVFGRQLLKALKSGHPCILEVEDTAHWVAVVSYKKRKITVVDTMLLTENNSKPTEFTLKEIKNWAHSFNKFEGGKAWFLFIELWPKDE